MADILWSVPLGDVVRASFYQLAGPPVNGTSGSFAGVTVKGDMLVDTQNGVLYNNTGTQSSPNWTPVPNGTYSPGLTAVGTSRANALQLTSLFNRVTTAASSAVGVILPPSATIGVGGVVTVANDGPINSFHVYGSGSDTIDGTAGSTGVALTNAFLCEYLVNAAGAYISFRFGFTRSS